jgi:hypothetical protein
MILLVACETVGMMFQSGVEVFSGVRKRIGAIAQYGGAHRRPDVLFRVPRGCSLCSGEGAGSRGAAVTTSSMKRRVPRVP